MIRIGRADAIIRAGISAFWRGRSVVLPNPLAMGWDEVVQVGGFVAIGLLCVAAIGRLLYLEFSEALSHHHAAHNAEVEPPKEEHPQSDGEFRKYSVEELEQCARRVEEYLIASEAYTDADLSFADVAGAVGISSKKVSVAINFVLGKTFYDLINGLRVEKSKTLLQEKKQRGLTLETIAEKCGFNSRIVYSNAFKKATGMTTTQWLKNQK